MEGGTDFSASELRPANNNGGAFRKELNPDFYGTMVDNFFFCDCKLQTIFLPYILLFKM